MELPDGEQRRFMDKCLDYDDELRWGGHMTGGEALAPVTQGATVRLRGGTVEVTDGPHAETKEVLGGLLFLEARDLSHAVALMSRHPGLGAGPFVIRPVDDTVNALVAERAGACRREAAAESAEQVRAVLQAWADNTRHGNDDEILARHDPDALIYDVLAPLRHRGAAAYRATWDAWRPRDVTDAVFEFEDLQVTAGEDLAHATALVRCGGTTPAGRFDDIVRATFCLSRGADGWRIVHQHLSKPAGS
jgi:ketosteroid isomerase-like protein